MYHPQKENPTAGIPENLKEVFNNVVKACQRSATKRNLHPNKELEQQLAKQLEKVIAEYGETFASDFQANNEKKNPNLSFLFAQVTNAVLERTFHEGRCHLQAAYALLELCKQNIFKASLVCSRTDDLATQHWYLILLDDNTFKTLSEMNQIYIKAKPNRFHKDTIFFDTWSNQLCYWKDFRPENNYTKALINSYQAVFRPLIHLFPSEEEIFKNIILCLIHYENYLKNLSSNKGIELDHTPQITSILSDETFRKEMALLTNPAKCIEKLLATIDDYKKEFKESLHLLMKNSVLLKLQNKYRIQSQSNSSSAFWQKESVSTMFRRAAYADCVADMEDLKKYFKVDINAVGKETQKSALHVAAENNSLAAIVWLSDNGANPNALDNNQNTPLHLACDKPHYKIIRKLLDNQADSTLTNKQNETPLMRLAKHNTGEFNLKQEEALSWLKQDMLDRLFVSEKPAFPIFHADGRLEILSNPSAALAASQNVSKREQKDNYQDISAYIPNVGRNAHPIFQKLRGQEEFVRTVPEGEEKTIIAIATLQAELPQNMFAENSIESGYLKRLETTLAGYNPAWYAQTRDILDEIEKNAQVDNALIKVTQKLRQKAEELKTAEKHERSDLNFSK